MPRKAETILDRGGIDDFVDKAAKKILEWDDRRDNIALVGIRTRGVHLASRIIDRIKSAEGVSLRTGILDITLYRDDLDDNPSSPQVKGTEIAFNLQGVTLVLVDDVVYTGRTVRAAIDQLIDFGRPKAIKLVVLVDRGHRELPIQPDFAGLVVNMKPGQDVVVRLSEEDGADEVVVRNKS